MLGAIIGDIVGSRWEFKAIKTKDFPLFSEFNTFTDDTIMTLAIADAVLNNLDPAVSMRKWARQIKIRSGFGGVGGYGQNFIKWLSSSEVQAPYNSYGNGGAMRVSPAAFLSTSLADTLDMAYRVTVVTHNHPEGIKGALATAHAIFLARQGEHFSSIKTIISSTYMYDLSRKLDDIRETYERTESSQGSVPESLICALEARDFEDAIRNAVSLGGDVDTMAAIAGGLAEAMFGIPEEIKSIGLRYLKVEMKTILDAAYKYSTTSQLYTE